MLQLEDMADYIKPIVGKKPRKIILHVGTNNVRQDKPKQLAKKIVDLANNIKTQHASAEICISSIIHRGDDSSLNLKFNQVNERLKHLCSQFNLEFICNDNIEAKCLNEGGLHLTLNGTIILAANFRKHINTF